MEKNFSIILPTRSRVYLLKDLLDSLVVKTHNKAGIEVLVVYDDDDEITDALSSYFLQKYDDIFLKMLKVKRSENFSRDYYNFLAKESVGRFVIACNDDSYFISPDWDALILQKIEASNPKKGIFYGWIHDNLPVRHGGSCCFPMLSREAINVFGRFFSERFQTWGADIHLHNLFKTFNAVIEFNVVIDHNSYHNGRRGKDQINYEVEAKAGNPDVQPGTDEINILRKAIG